LASTLLIANGHTSKHRRAAAAARPSWPRFAAADYVLPIGLGVLFFLLIWGQAQRLPDWFLAGEDYFDVWFDGDSPRYMMHMADRLSDTRDRSFMHPLLSYAFFPVFIVHWLTGLPMYAAVRVVLGLVAGAWVSACYYLLRLIRHTQLDAFLLTLLGGVSASGLLWFVLPESWALGSVTLLLAMIIVAVAEYRPLRTRWYILTSALTMAISVTNWMLGMFIAFATFAWRRALWITLSAFGSVGLLCVINMFIFPTFKIGFPEYAHEYIFQASSGGALHILNSFFYHTIIAPAFRVVEGFDHPHVLAMTFQQMAPGSASLWGLLGCALWTALLGLGIAAQRRVQGFTTLRQIVWAMLLGQLTLHTIYGGGEVFLYSMHWLPFLLIVVGWSCFAKPRGLVRALLVALILCAAINNLQQLDNAMLFVNSEDAIRGRLLDPAVRAGATSPTPAIEPPKWAR
jgi:hypothetical protein